MPIEAAALSLSGQGVKKAGEGILADLYQLAKRQGLKWKAKKHADTLSKRVRQLRLVKTIWQSEREIDLTKFYYPSRVWIENKRVEVDRLADLQCDNNILIRGTVGQGKSIFLRYLATVEFCLSHRIPVFVELRKIREGLSLRDLLIHELKTLGFSIDEELFHWMASQGILVLFLDAFDEVKEELRNTVLSEIEDLARRHERLRVVVSSRPETGAAHSSGLRVFNLCPLEGNEYEAVVQKMAHDQTTAKAIIDGVRRASSRVVPLLTTPLMVALLMIRFRIDQTVPNNIAAFYESLFMLLLQRHDKTKGGYIRPKKSRLSDSELETFFNALSFLTSKANEMSFTRSELAHYAGEAVKLVSLNTNVDHVIADIIDVTCLILAEGDERRFIHKSVQEYHAALFIKDQPDPTAAKFYEAMKRKWRPWRQQLEFLAIIDRYRYLKYLYIPQLREILGCAPSDNQASLTIEQLAKICGSDQLAFNPGQAGGTFSYMSTSHWWPIVRILGDVQYPHAIFNLNAQFTETDLANFRRHPQDHKFLAVSVQELLKSDKFSSIAEEECRNLLERFVPELNDAQKYVSQIDERKVAFDF